MNTRLSGHPLPRNPHGCIGRPAQVFYANPLEVVRKLYGRRRILPPSFKAMTIMECWL